MAADSEPRSSGGSREAGEAVVPPGDFPFPIVEGGESRYLKWIRDHANYMAVRGWSDYFRAVSVLVRGAFINFLIVLPVLLVIALVVASIKIWAFDLPFGLTWLLAVGTLLAFMSFPFRSFVAKIAGYRKSQDTGSDSSVKQRDLAERRVGALLIAVAAAGAFEALPVLLDPFHAWVIKNQFGWEKLSSVLAAGMFLFSAAGKVLSKLPRAAGILTTIALGALGLLLPVLVILSVGDMLYFDPPPAEATWKLPTEAAIWFLPVLLLIALIVGCLRSAFSLKDILAMSVLLAISVVLASYAVEWRNDLNDLSAGKEGELARIEAGMARMFPALPEDQRKILVQEPGPHLRVILEQVRDVSAPIPEHHALAEERVIDPIAAQVRDELSRLRQAHMPESMRYHLDDLAREILKKTRAPADGSLADIRVQIGHLAEIIDILQQVFRPQAPEALMQAVCTMRDEDLSALGQDDLDRFDIAEGTQQKYRALLEIAEIELSTLLRDAVTLGRELRAARWETNHRAHVSIHSKSSEDFVHEMRSAAFPAKALPVFVLALLLWVFGWLTIDVNLTSIHGLYRDRLASAFLVGADNAGDVDIEGDIDLGDLCCHEAGSVAPYHLINVALNLQGSRDLGLRDRRCDFFIFSKKFAGSSRTGYCRSESLERVFPQMSLASAMAISAAAASPNMGRGTTPALVALMTLLNIRLGIWVPNPGLLQEEIDASNGKPARRKGRKLERGARAPGFTFDEVFEEELGQIRARWAQLPGAGERRLASGTRPDVAHGLVGLAFSGGGIRSAAVNLGIVQVLHDRGLFEHVDYMSTVSGGGYLGSSISALMRRKTKLETPRSNAGEPSQVQGFWRRHWKRRSFGELFRWQVPARALLWEMLGWLDESKRWVNLSDGGHIENMGAIELLRRNCKYVIIGDGEADPAHGFSGLATLIRTARLDLGVRIDIDTTKLRLDGTFCSEHWLVGRINYPHQAEPGYLLYLKSSITGDEDEVIREYRHAHPAFPHDSTADQMFDEAQFEAYRSLGQHIAEHPLAHLDEAARTVGHRKLTYAELTKLFDTLAAP